MKEQIVLVTLCQLKGNKSLYGKYLQSKCHSLAQAILYPLWYISQEWKSGLSGFCIHSFSELPMWLKTNLQLKYYRENILISLTEDCHPFLFVSMQHHNIHCMNNQNETHLIWRKGYIFFPHYLPLTDTHTHPKSGSIYSCVN